MARSENQLNVRDEKIVNLLAGILSELKKLNSTDNSKQGKK